MPNSNAANFENSIMSLEDEVRELVSILHTRAMTEGYIPFISAVGKKDNNYKIEYKKSKSSGSLYVARIDGKKLSLRCKLFHLNEYSDLLYGLNENVMRCLLLSKSCVSDVGCKGPVSFTINGNEYSLCRHSIKMDNVTSTDADSIWGLLEAEIRYNAEPQSN